MALPTAANVNHPVCWGYGAYLDNKGGQPTSKLYLRLADSPDRVSGIQMVEPPDLPRVTENPEDIRAESGTIFSRSQFSSGEGLDRAHRRQGDPEFDAGRYWDSRNIKVEPSRPGFPEELTLLNTITSIRSSSNTNHHMARIGTKLFWAEASDVLNTANPTASSPTINSEDPEAGGTPTAVSGLAVLGDELYAALGAEGIHKRSSAGSWAHWSDLDCSGGRIWGVKGRIFAASGVNLYEAGATTDSSLLKALPSGQTWTDVVDAGTVVIAAASDGSLYLWAEESATLVLRSQEDFEGEVPYALGMSQGTLFVGTGQTTTAGGKIGRLWTAEVIGQRIRNAQVIREWGTGSETRDRSPRSFLPTRDSMFFGAIEDGSETHLWRFHLATHGLTRDLIITGSGLVQGLEVVDNRLFASLQAANIHRQDTTFATSGWLISPLADFFTTQPKVWVGGRLEAQLLVTQETATLHYSTNPDAITNSAHASWTSLISYTSATTQATIETENAMSAVRSRYVAVKITLGASTDQTTAPTVYSFAVRALPIPVDQLIRLYVNVSDLVVMPFRKPIVVPEQGKRIWEELRDNWQGKNVEVHLYRPSITVRGQIVGLTTPIQGRLPNGTVQVFSILDVKGMKV